MEKYILLQTLTDLENQALCYDINNIIVKLMNISDFQYGRMYQLVIDKTKNIENIPDRRYECLNYIDTLTKSEIIKEAYVISKRLNKRKINNEWHELEIDHIGNFYFGRCIQFILDSNNKINIKDLLNKTELDIVQQAHEMKTLMLASKKGTEFAVRGCDCDTWYVGDKRCDCGNRRCYLESKSVRSLDDTSICEYVAHY